MNVGNKSLTLLPNKTRKTEGVKLIRKKQTHTHTRTKEVESLTVFAIKTAVFGVKLRKAKLGKRMKTAIQRKNMLNGYYCDRLLIIGKNTQLKQQCSIRRQLGVKSCIMVQYVWLV